MDRSVRQGSTAGRRTNPQRSRATLDPRSRRGLGPRACRPRAARHDAPSSHAEGGTRLHRPDQHRLRRRVVGQRSVLLPGRPVRLHRPRVLRRAALEVRPPGAARSHRPMPWGRGAGSGRRWLPDARLVGTGQRTRVRWPATACHVPACRAYGPAQVAGGRSWCLRPVGVRGAWWPVPAPWSSGRGATPGRLRDRRVVPVLPRRRRCRDRWPPGGQRRWRGRQSRSTRHRGAVPTRSGCSGCWIRVVRKGSQADPRRPNPSSSARLRWGRSRERTRRGGGTGRRGGLKHRWGQPRASSNLALGTSGSCQTRAPSAAAAEQAALLLRRRRAGARFGRAFHAEHDSREHAQSLCRQ